MRISRSVLREAGGETPPAYFSLEPPTSAVTSSSRLWLTFSDGSNEKSGRVPNRAVIVTHGDQKRYGTRAAVRWA